MTLVVEDGTGLPGADSYEDAVDTAARLAALGFSSFARNGPSSRERIIREETSATDTFLGQWVSGQRRNEDQGLLYPRHRSFRRDGRELEVDEVPREILDGVAMRCEANAARRWVECEPENPTASPPAPAPTFFNASPEAYARLLNLMDIQRG